MEFLPLAEENGQILPIGHWVLEEACAQLKIWEQNHLTSNLTLSVNVSARQFHQADFVDQVQTVVKHYGINPKRLKLELTESILLKNIEDVVESMNVLNEIGVRFSLDDFGTSYSSLQYLKKLPLAELKIDQSFVRDIELDSSDQVIVRTIIAMAHNLELNVIAEGVETEGQRELLINSGCNAFQGYLFGKPVLLSEFESLLQN
jgi:EAL domain-containing protein (putative c-di-GMP-specific phosphodiesterase class I)